MMMITCLIGDAVGTAFAASAAQARSAPAKAATQAPSANLYLRVPIAESIHRSLLEWVTSKRGRMLGTSDVTRMTSPRELASVLRSRPTGGLLSREAENLGGFLAGQFPARREAATAACKPARSDRFETRCRPIKTPGVPRIPKLRASASLRISSASIDARFAIRSFFNRAMSI